MVQVIKTDNPQGRLAEQLGMSLGQGLGNGLNTYFANRSLESVMHDKALEGAPTSQKLEAIRSALSPYGEKGQEIFNQRMQIEQQEINEKTAIEAQKAALEKEKRLFQQQKEIQAQKDAAAKERVLLKPPSSGARSAQPISPEINKKIGEVLGNSKGMNADELKFAFDQAEIPTADYAQYIENRRRSEETGFKTTEDKRKELTKETLPLRTEYAKKAQASEKGIQNKQGLLNLIEKGNLNDPTYAALAEALPLNLGKRLLSNDTTEYKAGLVEEFTDLRNIFQGQTRIKEIDLLENKIADLYHDDEQKKAVIRSRINALKADMIRAEAAAELENRDDLGVLQFEKEVEKIAKPKLEALFNQILEEQKAVIDSAERKKEVPLNINDPEDKQIIEQIFN